MCKKIIIYLFLALKNYIIIYLIVYKIFSKNNYRNKEMYLKFQRPNYKNYLELFIPIIFITNYKMKLMKKRENNLLKS